MSKILLLTLFFLGACGDDASSPDASTDSATDATTDTSDPMDSTVAMPDASPDASADASDAARDAAPDADTGDAAMTALSGTTSLVVSDAPNTVAVATFAELPIETLTSNLFGCTELRSEADCQRLSCGGALPRFATAGTFSVDVDGTRLADIDAISDGVYSRLSTTADAAAGDVIDFSLSGGEVPVFTVSATRADALTITLPTTIRRSEDLALSWSVGAMGAETTRIALSAAATPSETIVCEVDAADAAITIPAALLADLPSGVDASIAVTAYNSARATSGGFDVIATAGWAVTGTARLE